MHVQKVKVKGQSVRKLDWQWTDGRTGGGDCISLYFPC